MDSRFAYLLRNRGGHALTAVPIGPLPAYLAVTAAGHPALAVPAAGSGLAQVLETEYLTLRLFAMVSVTELGGTQVSNTYHLLTCKKSDQDVIRPFEALATGLAESLTTLDQTDDIIAQAFETLCELFRTKPLSDLARARIGLWAELFFMREIGGFQRFGRFWHADPKRRFDFSSGQFRLELKATTRAERTHTFAHRQLYSAGQIEIMVGSFILTHEDTGLSLAELIAEARTTLATNNTTLLKLERSVRAAGMAETEDRGPVFDVADAHGSLRFYRSESVPHFPIAEPPGVSEATYNVTLTTITPVPEADFRAWLSLWR